MRTEQLTWGIPFTADAGVWFQHHGAVERAQDFFSWGGGSFSTLSGLWLGPWKLNCQRQINSIKRFISCAYGGLHRSEMKPPKKWSDPQASTKENTFVEK